MKKTLLLFSFILTGFNLIAQQSTVSGQVIDSKTKESIPFATIAVSTKADSTYVSGNITNETGGFSISRLNKGEYIIDISFVGYESKAISLTVGESNPYYNLGKIELAESALQIDGVVITGHRPTVNQNLDSKSFNIDGNISQAGGSVLDAMSNLPGVSVDQEGKVLLRGSDMITVLIDGQQSALTGLGSQKGLENISAANIERIEIINNPSARYDAAGMAGVINIIYKKERQGGFSGDVGFTYGVGVLNRRRADLPSPLGSYNLNPKYMPSLNLNYKARKVNVFLQSEFTRQRSLPNNEFTERRYDDGTTLLSQVPENRTQAHYLVKGGVDWLIDERNTLTVSGVYDYEDHEDIADVTYFRKLDMRPERNWSWRENENTGLANVSATFRHRFEQPGRELNASLQYTSGWEDEQYWLREVSDIRIGSDTTHVVAKEHITQLSVDYVHPLAAGRIEAGIKGHLCRLPVTYDVGHGENSVIYPGLGGWSDWGEDMASVYVNWLFEKTKYAIEAGLRAEYTNVFYSIADENVYYPSNDAYDKWNLFPNVRLTWKINQNNSLSTFYNRRVDRPGEAELRIFPKYDDPELLKVGNPYLRPQYTNNFELAYKFAWNSGSVYVAGYHREIKDHFTRIYATDQRSAGRPIINKVYQNTGQNSNTGIELIAEQRLARFWKLSGCFNFYRNKIFAFDGMLFFPYERPFRIEANSGNTWYAKLNNQLDIGKRSQLQLSGAWYAAMNIPQGQREARGGIDVGFRHTFFGDRLECTLSMKDVFNTMGIKETVAGDGFTATYENYYETQVVSIGAKLKF